MGLTNDLLGDQLDHYLGGPDIVRPANVWIGLHVEANIGTPAPPSEADGSGFVEPVGNAYARVQVANDGTTWNAASLIAAGDHAGKMLKDNLAEILFPEATGGWGTPTHVGVFEAATGGAPRVIGDITSGNTNPVGAGNQVRLAPGAVRIRSRRA